jgi:hypothetical protein
VKGSGLPQELLVVSQHSLERKQLIHTGIQALAQTNCDDQTHQLAIQNIPPESDVAQVTVCKFQIQYQDTIYFLFNKLEWNV